MIRFAVPAMLGLLSATSAYAQDPPAVTTITRCKTISEPGSYRLAANLSATSGTCLTITASYVTLDLDGFTLTGPTVQSGTSVGISAPNTTFGITVRNGSLSGWAVAVNLGGNGSIVEGLRIANGTDTGIAATGIIRNNTVTSISSAQAGTGINGQGVIIGNFVTGTNIYGIAAGFGSTVIGNSILITRTVGLYANCPSNITNNSVVPLATQNTGEGIVTNGTGCLTTNNVAMAIP